MDRKAHAPEPAAAGTATVEPFQDPAPSDDARQAVASMAVAVLGLPRDVPVAKPEVECSRAERLVLGIAHHRASIAGRAAGFNPGGAGFSTSANSR